MNVMQSADRVTIGVCCLFFMPLICGEYMRNKIFAHRFLKHIALAFATLWCITALTVEAKAQATDTTPPRIQSIKRFDPVGEFIGAPQVVWQVTFTEDVTNVAIEADFGIGSNVPGFAATSAFTTQITPSVYLFTLQFSYPVANGGGYMRPVPLNSATIYDMAGNAMTNFSVIGANEAYRPDYVGPTLSITSPTSFPTNNSVIPLSFTFSEIVTDFDASDLILNQGTGSFSNFSGSGRTYTAYLTLSSAGAFEVAVADAAAVDRAGNSGTGATFSGTRDVTAPTAVLSGIPSQVNGPFDVTVTFDKDVTGFAPGDFTLVNGTASNLQAVSSRVYSATITPDADGTVTVSVGAGAATDAAGNGNTASNSESTTADVTAPTVTLGVPSGMVNAPFTLTMTFSEGVTGLGLGDIVVSNGAATNLQQTSTTVYTATITPASDGTVTVDFPENSVRDAIGNDNEAAGQVSVIYDATAPTATLVSLASDGATPNIAGVGDTITLSLTFDEDMMPPTVAIQGEAASVSGSGTNWTASLSVGTSTARGGVSFTVSAIEDRVGNTASNVTSTTDGSFIRIGDPPVFSAVFSPDAIIQGETSTLTFTIDNAANVAAVTSLDFSNNLPAGLEVADPAHASTTCTGGTLTAVAGAGTLSYAGGTVAAGATCTVSADVRATAGGSVVNISGNLTSSLGNSGSASDTLEVTADTAAPVLTLEGVPETFEAGDIFSLTFTFSENVTGFDAGDIGVTGGTLSGFSGGPSVFTATLTTDGTSNVTVTVAEGAAEDAAGNLSTAASATSTMNSVEIASEMITRFMETRARNLIQNQPRLSGFLRGRRGGQFSAQVTRGHGDFDIQTGTGPVWFSLRASATEHESGGDSAYALATFGSHVTLGDGLIVGGMLQLDYAEDDMGGGIRTRGHGWMLGPYVVAQLGDQPLFFEGRLLYGESDNEISPLGSFTDSFESERWLTMVAVEGSYEAEALRYFPRLQFSHAVDTQMAYVDGLSNPVPEQTIRLSELSAGVDFEMPLFGPASGQLLTWGLSGIWSRVEGDGAASAYIDETENGRGRIDLGYRFRGDGGLTLTGDLFVDGLGSDDFMSYGAEVALALEF